MYKAFVCGICGFVGSHLACKLYEEGFSVSGLDRSDKTRNPTLAKLLKEKEITLFTGDITSFDFTQIEQTDYVYQAAGKLSVWGDIADFNRVNVDGTKRVIDFAKQSGAKVVVYLSSTAVYGYDGYCDLKEDAPKRPMDNPYSLSKLAAETMVMRYSKEIGQNYIVIRPGNVYGEYDMTSSYDIYKLLSKGNMPVVDKGRHKSCFVYAGNLVEGIYKASVTPEAYNEDYNITDGFGETLYDYMANAAKALGKKPKFFSLPAPLSILAAKTVESVYKLLKIKSMPKLTLFSVLQNCKDYHFSIEKSKAKFGYQPKVSLEEGTRRTAEWFKSMPHDIKVKR